MQTPDTPAGRVTEDLMQAIRAKLPDLDTPTFNKIYEAILERFEEKAKKPVPANATIDSRGRAYEHGANGAVRRIK